MNKLAVVNKYHKYKLLNLCLNVIKFPILWNVGVTKAFKRFVKYSFRVFSL